MQCKTFPSRLFNVFSKISTQGALKVKWAEQIFFCVIINIYWTVFRTPGVWTTFNCFLPKLQWLLVFLICIHIIVIINISPPIRTWKKSWVCHKFYSLCLSSQSRCQERSNNYAKHNRDGVTYCFIICMPIIIKQQFLSICISLQGLEGIHGIGRSHK